MPPSRVATLSIILTTKFSPIKSVTLCALKSFSKYFVKATFCLSMNLVYPFEVSFFVTEFSGEIIFYIRGN